MTISAFGVDHGAPIAKAAPKERKNATGAALAAGGGTVATVGLAGGGVPGVKSTRLLHDVKQASGRKSKAAAFGRAYRGGEFGYRHNAHHTFKTFGLGGDGPGAGSTLQEKHDHAVRAGKVGAEDTIIRHLKVGRRASNVALVGGAAVAAYGVNRTKSKVEKSDRSDRANGALAGGGLATAGLAHGGRKLMHHEGDKWSERARTNLLAANQVAPRNIPKGTTPYAAKEAGALRGAAAQGKYFGAVYHEFGTYAGKGRNPALAAAAVGAGGLALTRKKKQPVSKSAFGVDHVSKGVPGLIARNARDIVLPASIGTAGIGAAGVAGHRSAKGKSGEHAEAKATAGYAAAGGAASAAGHVAYRKAGLTIRDKGIKLERTLPEGMSRSQRTKIERDHRKRFGLEQGDKAAMKKKPGYFREYPKTLPGWKYKRALGAISGGREHAVGAAASALPVAAVAAVAHHNRKAKP